MSLSNNQDRCLFERIFSSICNLHSELEIISARCFVWLHILVEVGVGNLLKGVDVVGGNNVRVEVHELNLHFVEHTKRQKVTFNSTQCVVRMVVCIFNEGQFFTLSLI